jgi:colanic acid/amylovoran biosynthesis glycosyltransferase
VNGAGTSTPGRTDVKIAYLVNCYPRTSHSFIRREIQAVERLGVEVRRYSVRPLEEELVSEADREEMRKTRVILAEGPLGHVRAVLATALRNPGGLARATALAFRMGRRSDRGLLRNLIYVAEACVLAGMLRRDPVDHVHAHFGTNSAAVAMLCHEVGGPTFSFTVHGPEEFDRPEFLWIGEKAHRAAFVVAISSFGRSQLYRWARFEDWPRIHVVRCGVEDELLRAPPRPVPSAPRLLCVARLSEQKGHLLLVEAAARLAAEGVPLEIVLAGDGPLRAPVEAAIRAAGLEGKVRVAGWMSSTQVREAIQDARALVLPSFAEGLPVVVMEALALGRPVITTAVAGTPELVEPGVNGWLVAAGSVEALVPAMRAGLEAPPERLAEMGRRGAALVAERHDVSREAARLVEHFRAAVGAGRPA